jgi:hypothetical protein
MLRSSMKNYKSMAESCENEKQKSVTLSHRALSRTRGLRRAPIRNAYDVRKIDLDHDRMNTNAAKIQRLKAESKRYHNFVFLHSIDEPTVQ